MHIARLLTAIVLGWPAHAVIGDDGVWPAGPRTCRIDRVDAAGRTTYYGSGILIDARTLVTARHVIGFANDRIRSLRVLTSSGTLDVAAPARPKPAVPGPDVAALRLPEDVPISDRELVVPANRAELEQALDRVERVCVLGYGGPRRADMTELRDVVLHHHPDLSGGEAYARAVAIARVVETRNELDQRRALLQGSLSLDDIEVVRDDLERLVQRLDPTGVDARFLPRGEFSNVYVPVSFGPVVVRADFGGPVIGVTADQTHVLLGILTGTKTLKARRSDTWLPSAAVPSTGGVLREIGRRVTRAFPSPLRETAAVQAVPVHQVRPAHVYDLSACASHFTARSPR